MNELPPAGDLAFVYGTLKIGGEYQWIMDTAGGEFLGRGRLTMRYPLVLDKYPCLLDQPGKGQKVFGEVYRIPLSHGWKHLDWLEGHPDEYERRLEKVELNGQTLMAWTYFYPYPEYLGQDLEAVEEFVIKPDQTTP